METDAKKTRQAGTVAKNPRGTDAKNPPQLAPLQKTPVTVWNVPTVAKKPYYRRKKTQPPFGENTNQCEPPPHLVAHLLVI